MCFVFFVFFKQKTAYEMRISDWSSDVCSSDLLGLDGHSHRSGSCCAATGKSASATVGSAAPAIAKPRGFGPWWSDGLQGFPVPGGARAGRFPADDPRPGSRSRWPGGGTPGGQRTAAHHLPEPPGERKDVVEGKSGEVRVKLRG